jgi:hypothetical protein
MSDHVTAKDAVEHLLEGRPHPTAQKLLDFHRANRDFFIAFAAEFFWLKKRGRAGAAKNLLQFLRGAKHWHGVDEFMVNDHIFPMLSRICILLYPALNNATLQLCQCRADEILETDVVPRGGKKKGMVLRASEATRLELAQLPRMPIPPAVQRRSKRHRTVTAAEAAWVLPYIKELVACSPHPRNRVLKMLLRHARTQPEIFALAEMTMRTRHAKRRGPFSILNIFAYSKQTVQRTAGQKKRFTLSNNIAGLYCRAAIMRNPRFNGWTEFKEDSTGKVRKGRANALLGCTLAPDPVHGEPYRRLLWRAVGQLSKPMITSTAATTPTP